MKKLINTIALLLIVATSVKGQALSFSKDKITGAAYYEEVVQVPNVSDDDLFKRAKDFIIANFKTADNNINFNEEEHSMVNAGTVKIDQKKKFSWAVYDGTIDFKFHVRVKDGRYKIRIDNISFHMLYGSWPDGMKTKTESYSDLKDSTMGEYLKEQANEKLGALVSAFKHSMAVKASKKNDDW